VFRTVSERERLARLITSNLLLCRNNNAPSRYLPQPLVLDKKTQERVRELPIVEIANDLHDSFLTHHHQDGWIVSEIVNEEGKVDTPVSSTLVPFQQLSGSDREYAVNIAGLIVGSILELGYSISQNYDEPVLDLDEDSQLLLLVEFLAENVHDCWASSKIRAGWVFGEPRSDTDKTHPNLIPYIDLYEVDMDRNRQAAIAVLRSLLDRGYRIQADS